VRCHLRSGCAHSIDISCGQALAEVGIIWKNLEMDGRSSGTKNNGKLHGPYGRTHKIVGISSWGIGMHGWFHVIGASIQGLSNIKPKKSSRQSCSWTSIEKMKNYSLPTACGPTRTSRRPILNGSRDLGIEHPNGRHISIEGSNVRKTIIWHREFHEKYLVCTIEATWKSVSTKLDDDFRWNLRWATAPGRTKPQESISHFSPSITMTSLLEGMVLSARIWGLAEPPVPVELT